jgi:hypothetical protein
MRGERLAEILGPNLGKIADKPFSEGVAAFRKWIDG